MSRKMSRGALKCAACAGILQRLFFPAPFRQISHFLCDLFRISLFQAESHLRHHKRLVLDHTGPIAEFHSTIIQFHDLPIAVHHGYRAHHLAHLSSVGACVHHRTATDGSGNSRCELQSGETMLLCSFGHLAHQRSCLCLQITILHRDLTHIFSDYQYNSAVSVIADQQITSVTDDRVWHIHQAQILLYPAELIFIFQIDQVIRRSADTEGSMQFHGFLKQNPLCRYDFL